MEKPVAGDNEKIFKSFFDDKYGEKVLKGKCVYKDEEEKVSISIDNSIDFGDKKVLIEIDSGNEAKLLVGQYMLLNVLCNDDKDILFVIVHYYKDKKTNKQYNPQRTISNLKLINRKVYANKGIKFRVFNKDGFEKLCQENKNVESLINKLYE